MSYPWKIIDILDLEFFLNRDDQETDQQAQHHQRDRNIFLEQFDQETTPGTRELLTTWLQARRAKLGQELMSTSLPGKIWQETTWLTSTIVILAGALIGSGITAAFLSYSGSTPVNVSGYFTLFILLQLLLLCCQGLFFTYRLLRHVKISSSILYRLLSLAMVKCFSKLVERSRSKLSGEQRLNLEVLYGTLLQHKKQYGEVFFWPVFILLQRAALSFNGGILAATLVKVSIADIAFGWQSTLQVQESFVAELVRLIALPWSWMIPENLAYPSFEQIQGSKIILKEGIYRLSTSDLTAWWPFLCFGVLTYGILPRVALLLWGRHKQGQALSSLTFNSSRLIQLRQRMLTPLVETNANRVADQQFNNPLPQEEELSKPASSEPLSTTVQQNCPVLALVPDEIWGNYAEEEFKKLLTSPPLQQKIISIRFNGLDQSEAELYTDIEQCMQKENPGGIILLQEAWQPPIKEIAAMIRVIRSQISSELPINIVLIGKPRPTTIFTPVKAEHQQIWTQTMQTIGDPHLLVSALVQKP